MPDADAEAGQLFDSAQQPESQSLPRQLQEQPSRLPVEVNLGLLRAGGIYTTDVLEYTTGGGESGSGEGDSSEPVARGLTLGNIAVTSEARGGGNGDKRAIVLRLLAEPEGPLSTHFAVQLGSQEVEVHVSALVMPRNKGNPSLRQNVHSAGFAADLGTEAASDWQGFA